MTCIEERIVKYFFYQPMSHFGVRELSRKTHTDTKTVTKYLDKLLHQKIVQKRKTKGSFPYFEANRLSHMYKFEKSHMLVAKIIKSRIVDFLEKETKPRTIVLFGSVKKGTYHDKSDVDLFIQSKYKNLDLSSFEKKIGHKINILFEDNLQQLSKGLLKNIYNGEVLAGELEVL